MPHQQSLILFRFGAIVIFPVMLMGANPPTTAETTLRELKPHYENVGKNQSYTHVMLELGMRMGAMIVDVQRNDTAAAKKSFKAFRSYYGKVAKMVPSWRGEFPTGPIDELERAVKNKLSDTEKRKLSQKVQNVCTNCHVRHMFPVQARFLWGDFSKVTAEDDSGRKTSFHRIMLDLANGLGAIRGAVTSNRFDKAKDLYGTLKERFTLMELACTECHAQPREYFIDSRVKGRLLKLGGLLRKGSKNVSKYNELLNEINTMSCFPCHQVHMPAAFFQQHVAGQR